MSQSYLPIGTQYPTRGVITLGFFVGRSSVGDPVTQKAYVTPQHPDGIMSSELRRASHDVQQTTALFWFYSNFRPFSGKDEAGSLLMPTWSTRGGAYGEGSYGEGAYGGGREKYVIKPPGAKFGSAEVRSEFGETISPDVLLVVGMALDNTLNSPEGLPLLWELIPPPPQPDNDMYLEDGQGNFVTTETGERILVGPPHAVVNSILARLSAIEAIIDTPKVTHVGIGHNNPPEEPLTDFDKGDIRLSIADLRKLLAKPSVEAGAVEQAAQPLISGKQKVGIWLGARLTVAVDVIIEGLLKGVSWACAFTSAVALFHQLDDVVRLIGQLH